MTSDGVFISNADVVQFKDPEAPIPVFPHKDSSSNVEVYSTFSESQFTYLQEGWTKEAIAHREALIPTIPVAFARGDSKEDSTLRIIATFRVPVLTVKINPIDLKTTDTFTEAVTSALAQPGPASKRVAIERVLATYGHFVPTRVDMGLSLSTTRRLTFDSVKVCIFRVGLAVCLKKS